MRSSVRARISAAWNARRCAARSRPGAANSLTRSNSLLVERRLAPDPLERQDAGRALRPEQRDDDQAAVHRARVAEVVHPVVGRLVRDQTGSLCSTTQVAIPVSPGSHGDHVLVGVDAAGGQRPEEARRPLDDLDRDVVALDQRAQALGDLLEDCAAVERGQDRLGDAEQLAAGLRSWRSSAADCSRSRSVASALAIAWAANDA